MENHFIFTYDYRLKEIKEPKDYKASFEPLSEQIDYPRIFNDPGLCFPVSLKLVTEFRLSLAAILIFSYMRDVVCRGVEYRASGKPMNDYIRTEDWPFPNSDLCQALNFAPATIYSIKHKLSQNKPRLLSPFLNISPSIIEQTKKLYEGAVIQIPYRIFCYRTLDKEIIFYYCLLYALYHEPEKFELTQESKQRGYMELSALKLTKKLGKSYTNFLKRAEELNNFGLLEIYQRPQCPWFYKPLISLEDF